MPSRVTVSKILQGVSVHHVVVFDWAGRLTQTCGARTGFCWVCGHPTQWMYLQRATGVVQWFSRRKGIGACAPILFRGFCVCAVNLEPSRVARQWDLVSPIVDSSLCAHGFEDTSVVVGDKQDLVLAHCDLDRCEFTAAFE
jgi:hypothetical protein